MNMQTNLMMRYLSRFFLSLFVGATMLLISCDNDDPDPVNEEELITTLIVKLTPENPDLDVVTLEFYDEDGDGPIAPVYTYTPSGNAAQLKKEAIYNAEIELLNESETPIEDVTEEIEEEADEHLFCFTANAGALAIVYADEEADYITGGSDTAVGLKSTWRVGATTGTGTVQIVLRHQPGTKTGACPGPGDSDIEVTFNVAIVE